MSVLFLCPDLRRVYIIGGAAPAGTGDEEERQVFLYRKAMSLVSERMPQLEIRKLKGYNDSLLSH